jgi:hypothetical protein
VAHVVPNGLYRAKENQNKIGGIGTEVSISAFDLCL